MGVYTATAALGVVVVAALELAWLRTGLLGRRTYWIAFAIVLFFQVVVDGLLTRLPDPTVAYADGRFLGVRFPFDIPVEDFLFGWAMVTLTLLLWERGRDRSDDGPTGDPVVTLGRR